MTQPALNERLRILVLEGAQRSCSDIMDEIARARADLLREVEGFSETRARIRPGANATVTGSAPDDEEAWSLHELLRHLVQAEDGVAERVGRLARGEPAEGSLPGRLGGLEDATLPQLLDALSAAHQRLRHTAHALDGSPPTDTTAPHPFAGDLNALQWLSMWAIHLRSHVRQAAALRADVGP